MEKKSMLTLEARIQGLIGANAELQRIFRSLPLNGEPEERSIAITGSELRAIPDSNKIEGYASVFNVDSLPLYGLWTEEVIPGAFVDSIKADDQRALLNHNDDFVLARRSAGTLRLGEDSKGLHYELDLGGQSYARDLYESVKRGDITGSSIGFRTITDTWSMKDGMDHRQVSKISLREVSPVAWPAFPQTDGLAARCEKRAISALLKLRQKNSLTEDDLVAVEGAVAALRSLPHGPASADSKHKRAGVRLRLAEAEMAAQI
jgi:HK97 family phage prohead protease